MSKMRAFWESFFVLILIVVLHFLGSYFNWYWTYKWFDIPMHFLGGLWVALTALWIFCYFGHISSIINYKTKIFFIVFLAIFIIGISWEIFELVGKITFMDDVGYWTDTFGDLFNDFLGGMVAYFYFIRRRKCSNESVCDPKSGEICN